METLRLLADLWPLLIAAVGLIIGLAMTRRDAQTALEIAKEARKLAQECQQRVIALEQGQRYIRECVKFIKDNMLLDPRARRSKRNETE